MARQTDAPPPPTPTQATVPPCSGDVNRNYGDNYDGRAIPMMEMADADFAAAAPELAGDTTGSVTTITRMRSFFPEAWLWEAVDLDAAGANVPSCS